MEQESDENMASCQNFENMVRSTRRSKTLFDEGWGFRIFESTESCRKRATVFGFLFCDFEEKIIMIIILVGCQNVEEATQIRSTIILNV